MAISDPRIVSGIVVSAGLAALAVWVIFQRRLTPPEKERRRRAHVNKSQRTTEALLTAVADDLIHFQYELRGVAYFASQDVSAMRALLPEDPERLIGPVRVKYDPRNPANSIVLCEEWSGLPAR